MKRFKEFLQEHFVNLLPNHEVEKRKWAPIVKSLLDQSYSSIGGIHGSGFSSEEDMIKNIPMWKIKLHQGKPVAVSMYKDKHRSKNGCGWV